MLQEDDKTSVTSEHQANPVSIFAFLMDNYHHHYENDHEISSWSKKVIADKDKIIYEFFLSREGGGNKKTWVTFHKYVNLNFMHQKQLNSNGLCFLIWITLIFWINWGTFKQSFSMNTESYL